MIDVDVDVDVGIEVFVRINVLTAVISSLASAFGADDSCIATIEKGVQQHHIIERIYLYYYDKSNTVVGKVTFHIDWDKYQAKIQDANGKSFELKKNVSIIDQIDKSMREIIGHMKKVRKDLKVVRIESQFSYRKKYTLTEAEYAKARKLLGHTPAKSSSKVADGKKFREQLRYVLGDLPELEMLFEHE